jgi:hypothetical protein
MEDRATFLTVRRIRWLAYPRCAIVLLCACALANGRVAWNAVRHLGGPPDNGSPEVFIARFQPLAAWLPEGTMTGFVIDEAHTDSKRLHPDGRLGLAQYALSPHLLDPWRPRALVIVDSDDPEAMPEMAVRQGWTLIVNLHNGVKLFSTPRNLK